ncbi:MAG TPA: MarR family winged helix-turn-helix transcriptional regulator [Gaiellaceae bacterium]|nr:MarR family winged helix-turn-helix transcriptional regulator [Gaiellaceae bacterium]
MPEDPGAERILRGAIVLELNLASRYANEVANRELRAAGVDPDEYGFLSVVGILQPVTRARLARAIGARRTTLRDAIRPLVERGHVREDPHPRDGRASLLTLTPAGQEIFDAGLPAFRRALRAIDEALDGKLDEYEESVWTVRVSLQRLAAADATPAGGRVPRAE